jgi:hypothetical protein
MSNVIEDLPADFYSPGHLLDANANVFIADSNIPNSYVYTERYACRKAEFVQTLAGTPSTVRPETLLYEEGNFNDIGGGFFEFQRKYAAIPEDVIEPVSYNLAFRISIVDYIGVNRKQLSVFFNILPFNEYVFTRFSTFISSTNQISPITANKVSKFGLRTALDIPADAKPGISFTPPFSSTPDPIVIEETIPAGTLLQSNDTQQYIGSILRWDTIRLRNDLTFRAVYSGTGALSEFTVTA